MSAGYPCGATHKKIFTLGEIYFKRDVNVIDCFGVDYNLYQWKFFDNYQKKWISCNEPTGLIEI